MSVRRVVGESKRVQHASHLSRGEQITLEQAQRSERMGARDNRKSAMALHDKGSRYRDTLGGIGKVVTGRVTHPHSSRRRKPRRTQVTTRRVLASCGQYEEQTKARYQSKPVSGSHAPKFPFQFAISARRCLDDNFLPSPIWAQRYQAPKSDPY